MEKDALLSHGAAYVLDDRSRIASDAHSALVCKTCGHVGESRDETLRTLTFDVKNSGIQCALCGAKNSSVTLPTTYCYSGLLLRELATVGIKVMHSFASSSIASSSKKQQESIKEEEAVEEDNDDDNDEELEKLLVEYDEVKSEQQVRVSAIKTELNTNKWMSSISATDAMSEE